MYSQRASLGIFLSLVIVAVFSSVAHGQFYSRTWVSGVGDDSNPCSRSAPCRTMSGAFARTVNGGEVNCLDEGSYGSVVINRSVTIHCRQVGGLIPSALTGIAIEINDAAAVVRLHGLNINGFGTGETGIKITAAAKVTIESTVIDGFTEHGLSVESTSAVQVVAGQMLVRNCGGNAVNVAPAVASQVTIADSVLSHSGAGLSVSANGTARISGNKIVHNTTGLTSSGKNSQIISFANNVVAGNTTNGAPTSTAPLL